MFYIVTGAILLFAGYCIFRAICVDTTRYYENRAWDKFAKELKEKEQKEKEMREAAQYPIAWENLCVDYHNDEDAGPLV